MLLKGAVKSRRNVPASSFRSPGGGGLVAERDLGTRLRKNTH